LFWNEGNIQREYLRWLSKVLARAEGVPEQWYSISFADFEKNFGKGLIRKYNFSPYELLSSIYPEVDWLPWQFQKVTQNMWNQKEIQRKFLDWLGKKLSYRSPEDFYKLTRTTIIENGGERLFGVYKDVHEIVSAAFPQHTFLPWMFATVSKGYWQSPTNRREYVSWLKEHLGIANDKALKAHHYSENHGDGLLAIYNRSPAQILASLGDAPSTSSTFSPSRQKFFWNDMKNQTALAESIGKSFGVGDDLSRWYDVSVEAFAAHGGLGLVTSRYNGSLYAFLKAVYPEYKWEPWRFKKVPGQVLNDPATFRAVLRFTEASLGLRSAEDWQRRALLPFYPPLIAVLYVLLTIFLGSRCTSSRRLAWVHSFQRSMPSWTPSLSSLLPALEYSNKC